MEYEKDSQAQEIVRKHVWFSMIAAVTGIHRARRGERRQRRTRKQRESF